ncbi:hypothetical protein RDI58_006492 [Solanum bulbocastanum]|uniref:Uncharacterized protein n=1 Tax=Solanum bulbocastanum TaxID=147425 RepID=A0AAN8YLW8_SOLBU
MDHPSNAAAQCQNSSPKNQTALNRGTVRDDIPQDIPEIEIMPDPVYENHRKEPDKNLEEQIMEDKETASLVVEEMEASRGHILSPQQ